MCVRIYTYVCTLVFEPFESNLKTSYTFTSECLHMFHRNKDILLQNYSAISKITTCPFDAILISNPQTIWEVYHRSPKYSPSPVIFHSRIHCRKMHTLRLAVFPQPWFALTSLLSKMTGQLFYRMFLNLDLTDVSSFLDLDHTFFNRNVTQ